MFSVNYVIPSERFHVLGQPKEISKVADSGNAITNCFCGDCGELRTKVTATYLNLVSLTKTGTMMYRWGEGFGGINGKRILQPGILDNNDDLDHIKPELEMFVKDRVKWIPTFQELTQHEAMPSPGSE